MLWAVISLAILALAMAIIELPVIIRKKKSKDAPITVHRAVYLKTTNLTANAAGPIQKAGDPFVRKTDNLPLVWFQLQDTGKTMSFPCYQHIAVQMPAEGTEGDIEIKGLMFRAFTWAGGSLRMDENDTTPQSVFLQS